MKRRFQKLEVFKALVCAAFDVLNATDEIFTGITEEHQYLPTLLIIVVTGGLRR
jgi:hypothetical protein